MLHIPTNLPLPKKIPKKKAPQDPGHTSPSMNGKILQETPLFAYVQQPGTLVNTKIVALSGYSSPQIWDMFQKVSEWFFIDSTRWHNLT